MSTPTASQDSHSTIPLTDEQREIWQEEERLIKAYQVLSNDSLAEGDPVRELAAETISTSSYQLKSIFDQDGNSIVKLEMETFEESRMHHLLCQSRPQITDDTVGTLVTVSKSTFSSRFSEYCHHMLDGLNWKDIFVAGGSVLACVLPEQSVSFSHADVDLYLMTRSEDEANRLTMHIYSVIQANVEKYAEERYKKVECTKTRRTLTIRTPWMAFQVITTLFQSPLEVLIGFDIDCACLGTTNGVDAVMTQRAHLALRKRYNLWMRDYRPNLIVEGRYQNRLSKYSRRGFCVLVPEMDWKKIPILEGRHLDRLTGVSRLALLDRLATTRPFSDTTHHTFTSGIEECIHGGDAWCKTCHKKLPHEEADVNSRLSFAEPISWQRHNLTYQDFDGGKQIRVLAGVTEVPTNFEDSVYLSSTYSNPADSASVGLPLDSSTQEPHEILSSTNSTQLLTSALSNTPGIVVPTCYCGILCSLKATKKEGPNFRRRFFCCRNSMTPGLSCKFFQWEGDALPYDQARSLRLKETVKVDHIPEAIQEMEFDTSKQLLAISSCFKSGRLSSAHRTQLKDIVLQEQANNDEQAAMNAIFTAYSQHFDLDLLSTQLTEFCLSISGLAVK